MKFPSPPSAQALATPDFAEFQDIANAYFGQVDPEELNRSITYEDIQQGVWRPLGFLAMHLLPAAQRNERQLRTHVWPSIDPGAGATLLSELPHRHGAHLGALVTLNAYAEQRVTPSPVSLAADHSHRLHESDGGKWPPGQRLTIEIDDPEVYTAGQRHYVPYDAFHKTVNLPRKTGVTFVLRGKVFCSEAAIHPAGLRSRPVFPEAQSLSGQELQWLWQELIQAR